MDGVRYPSREHRSGKWGRGHCVVDTPAAPVPSPSNQTVSPCRRAHHVISSLHTEHIFDLYTIGDGSLPHLRGGQNNERLFCHEVKLCGPLGKTRIQLLGLLDGGARVGALDLSVYKHIKSTLTTGWNQSNTLLRMANGTIV